MEKLAQQLQIQRQADRKRMTWWLPWVFVVGLCFAALGLYVAVASYLLDGRRFGVMGIVFTIFFLLFGWSVLLWLTIPLRIKPRIVPYFASMLADYGGASSAAFKRGRQLYLQFDELERRAVAAGVTPLSAYGFADDYYGQEVRWRSANEGLNTVMALRAACDARDEPELAADLAALEGALRIAQEKGVTFSLALRPGASDSLQVVSSMEVRSGRFW